MPTAAKLAAAVLPLPPSAVRRRGLQAGACPSGTVWGYFNAISAAIGLLCGWFVMGGLVGQGYRAAIGYGLRTVGDDGVLGAARLLTYLMVLRSMSMRYDGPMEAVRGHLRSDDRERAAAWNPAGASLTLLLGGIVGGMLTEWVGRRWK